MTPEDLQKLISSAKNRNPRAQTQLINLFWIDVFSFVLNKVQDKNSADEITVSVFSKVLSKLDLYKTEFDFKIWVLSIAQNTIIDYWRKKSRDNEDSTENFEGFINQFAKSPEELLISEEDQSHIISVINTLDSKYQDIIRLRFFDEKSIKEISEELKISVSNTKVRIMRAKKLLGELLKDNGFEE